MPHNGVKYIIIIKSSLTYRVRLHSASYNDELITHCRHVAIVVNCISDTCDAVPCKNGGTCELADNIDGYECKCPMGFSGTDCENGKET